MILFGKNKKEDEEKEERETEGKPAEINAGESFVALPKGGDYHSYGVVVAPYTTEKGTILSEHNKYVFKVTKNANKTEISKAVENLYKVGVNAVRVVRIPSKYRKVGRFEGHKPGFKKAIVTLKEGSKIDLAQ